MKKSIGFIGGGRITKIILQAFANKQQKFNKVVVFDTNADVLDSLKNQFPFIESGDLNQAARQSTVFIALHPPMIMETLDKIAGVVPEDALIISLAPKISIGKIASKLKTANIARMIPNATSYINEGFNPVCFSEGFNSSLKENILEILRTLGHTFEVAEEKMEGYAIMSAMLPTYFWFQMKELIEIGEQVGLTAADSQNTVRDTLIAAIRTYFYSGLQADEVMDLIPVKPIAEYEEQIAGFYKGKLLPLFDKIRP